MSMRYIYILYVCCGLFSRDVQVFRSAGHDWVRATSPVTWRSRSCWVLQKGCFEQKCVSWFTQNPCQWKHMKTVCHLHRHHAVLCSLLSVRPKERIRSPCRCVRTRQVASPRDVFSDSTWSVSLVLPRWARNSEEPWGSGQASQLWCPRRFTTCTAQLQQIRSDRFDMIWYDMI